MAVQRQTWNSVTKICRGCGSEFGSRRGTGQQIYCHPKCRDRARHRPAMVLPAPNGSAVPLTQTMVLIREELYRNMHPLAVGTIWECELLGGLSFPLVGRRKTLLGTFSDLPYFPLGGFVENGIFEQWEPPLVPINADYKVKWFLRGSGRMEELKETIFRVDFCKERLRAHPLVRDAIAKARATLPATEPQDGIGKRLDEDPEGQEGQE